MSKLPKLPDTIVGIDIETTSLTPATGDIIEVAAIRYDLTKPTSSQLGSQSGEIISFTLPRQPLSAAITSITSITQDMVANSPPFSELIGKLGDFIGNSLLFAHNANFDIDFLTYHGLNLKKNPVWDTFLLASLAWPTAPSYNLGMLAEQLHLSVVSEHRAGDDVRLTWQLLNKIYQQLTVSRNCYQQIIETLKKSGQEQYLGLFLTSLSSPNGESTSPSQGEERTFPSLRRRGAPPEAGRGGKSQRGERIANLEEIFSTRSPLAKTLPNFSFRPEQLAMAQRVAGLIRSKQVGFIEAGPGTGKTYAYLVPLLLHLAKQKGAVISTYTKNLQDQLSHDIPQLIASLGLPYQVALLKGRRNYLCLTRLLKALQPAKIQPDNAWLLIKLLVWLDQGTNGDLERLNVSHQAHHLLRHLHADALSCRLTCSQQNSQCPYQRARRRARQADIVVINHALLMQLGGEDSVLPLNHVIIDEAHHLEEVARQASCVDFSEHRVEEILAPVSRIAKAYPSRLKQRLTNKTKQLFSAYKQFLQSTANFLNQHTAADHIRLTPTLRRNTSWQKIVQTGTAWRHQLQFLNGLVAGGQEFSPDHELVTSAIREAEQFSLEFETFLKGSAERIQWIQYDSPNSNDKTMRINVTLNDEALSVKPQLSRIFSSAHSVTLTSATLTIAGNFGYIKKQLGLTSAEELKLNSSFSYRDQMLIYIVDDSVSPTTSHFDSFTAQQIERLAKLLSGRVLGLFTSYQSVHCVYDKIINELNKANIKLLAQKITGGRSNITNRFKNIPASVLLGTYSFWEGIDTPGDTLSCVVIPKLPFPVPHNPIHEAQAEALSVNVFTSFSLPQMIIKLRQGIGRLIRSASDSGAIVILDSRFLRQDYGTQVLLSLPPATVHIGSQNDLIPTLKKWYGETTLDRWRKELKEEQK